MHSVKAKHCENPYIATFILYVLGIVWYQLHFHCDFLQVRALFEKSADKIMKIGISSLNMSFSR